MLNKLKNKKILVSTLTNIVLVVTILLFNFKIIDIDMSDKINQVFAMVLTLVTATMLQLGILTDSEDKL